MRDHANGRPRLSLPLLAWLRSCSGFATQLQPKTRAAKTRCKPRVWGRNGRDRAGPTRARSACVRACEIARTSSPRRSPTQRLEGAASLEPGAMRPRRRGRREPARAQGRAEPAVYERHGRSRAAGSAGASPQSGLRPSQGGVEGGAAPAESLHGAQGRRDSDAPGPQCGRGVRRRAPGRRGGGLSGVRGRRGSGLSRVPG